MGDLAKYTGSVAEIITTLNQEKPNKWDFVKIFKAAILANNDCLLDALGEYKKANENSFAIKEFLSEFSSAVEIKANLEKLIKYLSVNTVMQILVSLDILEHGISYYTAKPDPKKIQIQAECLKIALDKGADINSIESFSLFFLHFHKDLLLAHPTNPLSFDMFLKHVLILVTSSHDELINMQSKLIKFALDNDANINAANVVISHETFRNNKDLLLKHPTNALSVESMFSVPSKINYSYYVKEETHKQAVTLVKSVIELGININTENAFFLLQAVYEKILWNYQLNSSPQGVLEIALMLASKEPEVLKLQKVIIEKALDLGADINNYKINLSFDTLVAHKELLLNHPKLKLSPDNFLKVILNLYYVDAEKLKLQAELIEEALDRGADINNSNLSLSFDTIVRHKDLLLNHPKAKLSADKLLQVALNYFGSNTEKIKLQVELIKEALDRGADINNSNLSISFDTMVTHKDLLLNHPKAKLSADKLLQVALNYFGSNTETIKQQAELIKDALDLGANINLQNIRVAVLVAHKELLLNHTTNPLSPDKLLTIALSDGVEIKQQAELIKDALDLGANINVIEEPSLESLKTHKDLLLNHPTNPLSLDALLNIILKAKVVFWHVASLSIRGELLKLALDKGANINADNVVISHEVFSNHKDLLLKHPTNALSLESLFSVPSKINYSYYFKEETHKQAVTWIKGVMELGININAENACLLLQVVCEKISWNNQLNSSPQGVLEIAFMLASKEPEVLKLQKVIIEKALDLGAVINNYNIHLSFDTLMAHKELLLNHPKLKLSPDNFLKAVLNLYYVDAEKLKQQSELIKEALDLGADINNQNISLSFDTLVAHKDLLLNHPKAKLSADKLLQVALNYSGADAEKLKQQSEWIKEALDRGADINNQNISLSFDTLVAHKGLLLNHPKLKLSPDNFLKAVLNLYNADAEKLKQQSELIKEALDLGADINNYKINLSFDTLVAHKELLLNHPKLKLSPDNFLKAVLNLYNADAEKLKQQSELIKEALDLGADINHFNLSLSFDTLFAHKDLFLNHPTHPISADKVLQIVLGYANTEPEKIKQQAELIKQALDNGADINHEYLHPVIEALIAHKDLLLNLGSSTLTPNNFLKLVFKSYSPTGNTKLEHELIEYAIAKGALIAEMPLEDFNLSYAPFERLQTLVKYGLDPRALILRESVPSFPNGQIDDLTSILQLIVKSGYQVPILGVIHSLRAQTEISEKLIEFLLENSPVKLNQPLIANDIFAEFAAIGPRFKEYIDKHKNDYVEMLANQNTLIHLVAKTNQVKILEHLFAKHSAEFEVNLSNAKKQTPLFFAKNVEMVKYLIEKGADVTVNDVNGDNWISSNFPSMELISYMMSQGYLTQGDYANKVLKNHFLKGNYEHASKILPLSFELKFDLIQTFLDAIAIGLANSIENNKLHAMVNLLHKAKIDIPYKFVYLVNNANDDIPSQEFKFLEGLYFKLAAYYISLAKTSLQKSLASDCELTDFQAYIDHAFSLNGDYDKYAEFMSLKEICPKSLELKKVNNSFDAYYQILGRAMNLLDNDFALEVTTLNGLRPDALEQDIKVFRGFKAFLGEDGISALFKYGTRGFSIGDAQKFLGYYVNNQWNKNDGHWEFGGTYVSLEPHMSSGFAVGQTAGRVEGDSILLEMILPKGSPLICGRHAIEYELVPSSIQGDEIIAIYKLGNKADIYHSNSKVLEVYHNPFLAREVTSKYKPGDTITVDRAAIQTYDGLGCKEKIKDKSQAFGGKVKNVGDFYKYYTQEHHQADQKILSDNYFVDRPSFEEAVPNELINDGFLPYCNPENYCCV